MPAINSCVNRFSTPAVPGQALADPLIRGMGWDGMNDCPIESGGMFEGSSIRVVEVEDKVEDGDGVVVF